MLFTNFYHMIRESIPIVGKYGMVNHIQTLPVAANFLEGYLIISAIDDFLII